MKKRKSIAIAALMVLALTLLNTGCATNNRNNQQKTTQPGTTQPGITAEPAEAYKDGKYEGKGDPWEYGSEDATVEIANGRIKSIILRRLDTKGVEVNYDDWTGKEIDGKIYPNLKEYRLEMANRMIEKQSYDVDTISGATTSTKNWKLAVQRALEKAK